MKQRALLLKLHNLNSFETNKNEGQTFDMIFRASPSNGKCMSPQVSKANPIDECISSQILPLPSTVEFKSGEVDDIGSDWEMSDDDSLRSNEDNDIYPIQTVTPLAADHTTSLYSFYFEENDMGCDEDDASVSLHDDVSLEDVDFCLDEISDNPEAFWSNTAMAATQERRLSPAQISLSSEAFDDLQSADSL